MKSLLLAKRVKISGVRSRERSGEATAERSSRAREASVGLGEERSLRSWFGRRRRTSVWGEKERDAER